MTILVTTKSNFCLFCENYEIFYNIENITSFPMRVVRVYNVQAKTVTSLIKKYNFVSKEVKIIICAGIIFFEGYIQQCFFNVYLDPSKIIMPARIIILTSLDTKLYFFNIIYKWQFLPVHCTPLLPCKAPLYRYMSRHIGAPVHRNIRASAHVVLWCLPVGRLVRRCSDGRPWCHRKVLIVGLSMKSNVVFMKKIVKYG